MNFEGIFHRSGMDCYALNENELVINIRTNKEITAVNLICEDPFINGSSGRNPWHGKTEQMDIVMELRDYLVWSITVSPKFKRLQYYFEIINNNEKRCLFEDGLYSENISSGAVNQYFKYAWMNPSDIYKAPEWVEDTCWYQIMPDRFCRILDSSDERQFADWNDDSKVKYNLIYGGNLLGITKKLPYLHDLGISGIYLTPIFESTSDHKYNTTDYRRIDPVFGTEENFRELVETAHGMGIKIMIDAVFNHCGRNFFAWKDVVQNGRKSEYYDWFYINAEDFAREGKTDDGRYFSFAFISEMPKLNTNNTKVADYLCGICKEWVQKWNVDGIRFDVGDEIAHSFIKKLRRELKCIKPDLFLLGEIWTDSAVWLQGDEYDSVMNYPFMRSLDGFFVNKKLEARDFMYMMNRCYSLYMSHVNRVLFNFLDNHDVGRICSRCKNEDIFFQQLALLMTMPGTPCIYYGTEIEMEGEWDPYNRKPMPWDKIDKGEYISVTDEVKRLIYLRKKYSETIKGSRIEWKETKGRLINYVRHGSVCIEVYVNAGEECEVIDAKEENIIFARKYSMGRLEPNGTLILLTS